MFDNCWWCVKPTPLEFAMRLLLFALNYLFLLVMHYLLYSFCFNYFIECRWMYSQGMSLTLHIIIMENKFLSLAYYTKSTGFTSRVRGDIHLQGFANKARKKVRSHVILKKNKMRRWNHIYNFIYIIYNHLNFFLTFNIFIVYFLLNINRKTCLIGGMKLSQKIWWLNYMTKVFTKLFYRN